MLSESTLEIKAMISHQLVSIVKAD